MKAGVSAAAEGAWPQSARPARPETRVDGKHGALTDDPVGPGRWRTAWSSVARSGRTPDRR
jgi:hypothetical protein